MTLAELRSEVWEHIGEPTDLSSNGGSTFSATLDRAINEGLRRVCMWKHPTTGRGVRWPKKVDRVYFQNYYTSGTLDASGTTTTVVFPNSDPFDDAVDDSFNEWVVTVGAETAIIVDYTASTRTASLATAITAPSSGDSYELSKHFIDLLASTATLNEYHLTKPTGFLVPQLIIDLEDEIRLTKRGRSEKNETLLSETGDPTQWAFEDDRLAFNYAPEDQRYYLMEYTRLPAELSSATDEPELPSYLHSGIVLWCRWWGYARMQGSPEAFAAKRDFQDYMKEMASLYDDAFDREVTYGVLGRG